MHTLALIAVLQGMISIAPIRMFQPYPSVKCPKGYTLWWPAGKEFENDKYAQCVQPMAKTASGSKTRTHKITTDVSLHEEIK
jgi:hypothetical protein